MSDGEKNNNSTGNKITVAETKPENKFITFLKNNKAVFFLGVILIFVIVWFYAKLQMNEASFKQKKNQIITTYESKIDSLKIDHVKFATEVFSWSVRSELIRENIENLNQLLTVFVKKSGVDLVQLISPKDKIVLLSSDKKFEGNSSLDADFSELTSTIVLNKENSVEIISPVMGFNDKIGVLIVELKSGKSGFSKAESEKLNE